MEYVEIDYYIKNVKLQVLTQYTKPKEQKEKPKIHTTEE